MIDLGLLRDNPTQIKELITRKDSSFSIDQLIALDQQVRSLNHEAENLRKEKNDISGSRPGSITQEQREKSIELGKLLKSKEAELEGLEKELKSLWLSCPNIPQEDLPVGGKEANKVIKTVGTKPTFPFTPKHHVEINDKVKWFDLQIAASMSGSQFVFYHEMGAKLVYALTTLMLKNNKQHGFTPVLPPYLVHEKALYNAGNLPKFAGDFYEVTKDGLSLIPTAEVSLTNVHANQILNHDQLPLRYTAWTSCFRREAGSYGAHERGLIRIHQFEKAELYTLCTPESSNQELERMMASAETLLNQLGLHYQISLLATGDCSFSSTKTYDIEVWLPGQNRYYEVSSCSNCTDFQSRRASIRYRKKTDSKPELVHTLNGSSLAIPRLMVALMETYQQEDGSIVLPAILEQAMNALW